MVVQKSSVTYTINALVLVNRDTSKLGNRWIDVYVFHQCPGVDPPSSRLLWVVEQQWHPCVRLPVGVLDPVVMFAKPPAVVSHGPWSWVDVQRGRGVLRGGRFPRRCDTVSEVLALWAAEADPGPPTPAGAAARPLRAVENWHCCPGE